MYNQAILTQIKEICEVSDMKELIEKLSTGKWIAFYGVNGKSGRVCLGRVE